MKIIHFRNSASLDDVKAVCYNVDESEKEVVLLSRVDDDGDFLLEFDDDRYDHIEFVGVDGRKTSKVYPGALSVGVEYKKNEGMGRELTYLFAKGIKKTGSVDNFVLKDEKNLAHREDLSKKISVYVPKTYDGVTPHDILYFFDAQNLFGAAGDYTENGDPYGSWQLDSILSEIYDQYGKNILVVGIDNADKYRDKELFMNPDTFGDLAPLATALPDEDYSTGHLENLDDFMKHTLHPFIKEKYCVKCDCIGIGGASMGGIAAFYCGLRDLSFYKYVLSYSPAYGLYEMSAFENWFSTKTFIENIEKLPGIHIYCGEGDPLERLLIGTAKEMKTALVSYGYPKNKIFETYDTEKPHNEESWRLILGESFTKLLDLQ